jgi:hypothetical protein
LPDLSGLEIEARQPEGYAFYSVYPQAYAAAASPLAAPDWRVIGVRSIGTSLAAMVAAALGAPPAVTVRPVGHPFSRRIELSTALAAEFAAHQGRFALVDEGPGLSGSSFGAVADALEALGVARERLHAFPSHGADLGPQASEAHRARWSALPRHHVTFEALTESGRRLLERAEALVGPAVAPLQDLSGGAWRALRPAAGAVPANAFQERRKYLLRTADGAWLLKFAGLGRISERKLALAQRLHAAGFSPEPAGLADGFLIERWIEPAPAPEAPPPLADYLRLRASLAANRDEGASLEALLEMARVNAAEAGLDTRALQRFEPELPRLQPRVRPVLTDNRLHRWEWIGSGDGRWLKTDAVDHHAPTT